MPPRKSNVSQATGTDDGGTPVKEREGTNIEVLPRSVYSNSLAINSSRQSPLPQFSDTPRTMKG